VHGSENGRVISRKIIKKLVVKAGGIYNSLGVVMVLTELDLWSLLRDC
jgi:hypothetical protein